MVNGYEFEKALQDKDVSGAVFKVYVALVRQESNTGIRALSLSELQEQTGLSRHTVIAALQTLKGKGLAQG
jgi:DNA-binding MarR family transcriptional regulator